MKKFIGALLALTMAFSGITAVFADTEEVLLSQGKPVEAGITGEGEEHSDCHGSKEKAVDGIAGTIYDQTQMWYLHSTVDADTIWLNIDLGDSYAVTKIVWVARYAGTLKADCKGALIYGANKADFSDKELIVNLADYELSGQSNEFAVSSGEYRYIRAEKYANMGCTEIQVYGYRNSATNANLSSLSIDGYILDSAFNEADTEYTVIAGAIPESLTVNSEVAAEGASVSVSGTESIGYGINEINVTVTSPDGTAEKVYTVNFIVTNETDISSGCTVTAVNNAKAGDASVFTKLFTSSVKRTAAWIFYDLKGYIDVDLGAEYSLSRFEWTKSDLEAAGEIIIEGSKTADYAQTVQLGVAPKLAKTETLSHASLLSDTKYRYLRIRKNYTNAEFIPLKIRIYAVPEIEASQASVKMKKDISSEIAGATLYNVTKGDTNTSWGTNATSGVQATPMNLFTGSETNTYVGYYEGYIQVDLGAEYNLSDFEWTRNGKMGAMKPVSIYASADAEFTSPVLIGQTVANELSCKLDAENAYRYIKIVKTKNSDWYPNTIRLYASVDDPTQADKEETSITVPSNFYSGGDTIIAAIYNGNKLCGIETAVAGSENAEKVISVTADKNCGIKVMVWNNLSGMKARVNVTNIK